MHQGLALWISMGALGLSACGDDGSADGGGGTGSTGPSMNTSTTDDSTSTTDDPDSTSTTDDMVDSTGSTGEPVGPDPIYETIAGGPFVPFIDYEASGRAHMVRTLDGQTVVELHIEGLEPDTEYPTHLHRWPCTVNDGGDHYQIEPGGPVDDVNEIWPMFTSDAEGVGQASLTVAHRVRGDAQSVVVHDPNAGNARLACADLRFEPTDLAEYEGGFLPFAAAEPIDDNIAGTASMEVRPTGTTVTVEVEGLDPGEVYESHVHEYPCDVADAGAHYQRQPGGPATADNELWPTVMPDAMGMASDSFEVDHVARGDAQSIVIHRMTPAGSPRVACAPLVRMEYPELHTTLGDVAPLSTATVDFDMVTISVTMERDLAGLTRASLQAEGMPAGEYPVHVHHRTCATNDGGGHYKIDPSIEDTVEDNEIWLNFTVDDSGAGSAEIEVEHTARPEALSVVVHNSMDSMIREGCADLDNLP